MSSVFPLNLCRLFVNRFVFELFLFSLPGLLYLFCVVFSFFVLFDGVLGGMCVSGVVVLGIFMLSVVVGSLTGDSLNVVWVAYYFDSTSGGNGDSVVAYPADNACVFLKSIWV